MEYTKGEWEFNRFDLTIRVKEWRKSATMGDYRGCIITDMKAALGAEENDVEIAKKVHPEGWRQTEANAYLIASAPMMYEALKAVDDYLGANYPGNMLLKQIAYEKLEKALSKAEGREVK
uniref:Uncharacterized protein n=1 Tax=viral metagenome TaxID=1070528 RepID=A0A6M3IZA3_9ZZZZ